jgi:sirohydrochlorin ferrochelatase
MSPALVAVSHGTSSAEGQAAVAGLVDAVRLRLPSVDVLDAYVDVQEPALEDVLDRLGEPAVVAPLLLAPGFHVHVDIARAVSGRAATTAAVLGPDRSVTGVLVDRIASVGLCDDDVLVLGVAGSRDVRAHHSVDRAATRLAIALGREVRVGHLGGTGRPIRDVISEAARFRSRIVVSTYLLAPGHFAKVLGKCGADVVTAPLLSSGPPDPRLVQLVVDRFQHSAALWRSERAS